MSDLYEDIVKKDIISRLEVKYEILKKEIEDSRIIKKAIETLKETKNLLIKEIEDYKSLELPTDTLEMLKSGIKIMPIYNLVRFRGDEHYDSLDVSSGRYRIAQSEDVPSYELENPIHRTRLLLPKGTFKLYLVLKPATEEEKETIVSVPPEDC